MIFKPYTAMCSIRSPPLSLANNISNPISSSNGCCVSGLRERAHCFFTSTFAPHVRFTIFIYSIYACQHRPITASAITIAKAYQTRLRLRTARA